MGDGVEVSVAVTPCVSNWLPLRGVAHGLKLDVALTPGVSVRGVCDRSAGWELLLLLCKNSAAFCCHSHAVVLWNKVTRERAKSNKHTQNITHNCLCMAAGAFKDIMHSLARSQTISISAKNLLTSPLTKDN